MTRTCKRLTLINNLGRSQKKSVKISLKPLYPYRHTIVTHNHREKKNYIYKYIYLFILNSPSNVHLQIYLFNVTKVLLNRISVKF